MEIQNFRITRFIATIVLLAGTTTFAQKLQSVAIADVTRVETELASDKMQGRQVFTLGIELASAFIENEFVEIGLEFFGELGSYRQQFSIEGKNANNVIGILKGKTKPDEFVVFSAHYDHLGIAKKGRDKIYNGANDDASGVAAVIALAKYFKELGNNARTIIFVGFTAEEIGGYGSAYFSKNINPEQVVAMFNIEMIGTESKWGKNSAYITGFEMTDFGTILQKNLEGSAFSFNPDPYPDQQLFYRSDNAKLAEMGVPAHTISTSKMDSELNYHQVSDEVSTLDLENMTEIIKAIAVSSQSIINGADTPTRIK